MRFDQRLPKAIFTDSQAPAADHQEPALQRLQVHPSRPGHASGGTRRQAGAPTTRSLTGASEVSRLLRHRYRYRHRGGQAGDHLRGLPAGRRFNLAKYGGTGLGLAISRELSNFWAVKSALVSRTGQGSTFTLSCPQPICTGRSLESASSLEAMPAAGAARSSKGALIRRLKSPPAASLEVSLLVNEAGDDRHEINPGDRVLLIIENDMGFARFLLDTAHENGYKGLVDVVGAAALVMTPDYMPDAILLDIHLADMQGLARARASQERHGDTRISPSASSRRMSRRAKRSIQARLPSWLSRSRAAMYWTKR